MFKQVSKKVINLFRFSNIYTIIFFLTCINIDLIAKDNKVNSNSRRIVAVQKIWVVDSTGETTLKITQPDTSEINEFRKLTKGQIDIHKNTSVSSGSFESSITSQRPAQRIPIELITKKIKIESDSIMPMDMGSVSNSELNQSQNPQDLPDLICYSASAAPNPVYEGASITITDCIYNYSYGNAAASHVALFLSTDNDFDINDDCYVGKQAVSALLAGYYENHQWIFSFPNIGSGSYPVWLVFWVDCDGEVAESNENNLFKTNSNFTAVDPSLPDLQVNTFAWDPASATEGSDFTTLARIINGGSAAAPMSHAALYLSIDNDFDISDDYLVGAGQINALAAGVYLDAQWSFTFPDLASGEYPVWLVAAVDCYGEVSESNENNVYICTQSIPVTEPLQSLPDLQVPMFWWQSDNVTEGDPFSVVAAVLNGGTSVAGSSHVRAFLSTDADVDLSDDYALGEQSVVSLPPDYYQTIEWAFNFPDLGSGQYTVYLIAEADCQSEVTESDETNLWFSASGFTAIDAVAAIPDISIEQSSINLYEDSPQGAAEHRQREAQPLNYNPGPARFRDELPERRPTGGQIPDSVQINWENKGPVQFEKPSAIQNSVDWSAYDSPVKDQGQCGSCWVMATVALVENLGEQMDLSEQTVLSCVPSQGGYDNSCDGGWQGHAYEYIKNNGIPHESCYPYIESDGNCADKCDSPEFLERVTDVYTPLWGMSDGSTVENLKQVLNITPVSVWMNVPDPFFQYSGGIFNYEGPEISGNNGHIILVVGYNDAYQYFKVKNSWGTGWGDNGYFYIAYDDVTDYPHFGGFACTAEGVYTDIINGNQTTLIVRNQGTGSLVIDEITTDQSWLAFTPTTIDNLAPNQQTGITLSVSDWNLVGGPSASAILNLHSNDPDEPVVQTQIIAYPQNTSVFEHTMNPMGFALFPNVPNPFNASTEIQFNLPSPADVVLTMYNLQGQQVCKIYKNKLPSGHHQIRWDGRGQNGELLASGTYFCWLDAGPYHATGKMALTK